MTPKVKKILDELEEDLNLIGLEPYALRVAEVKKLLTPVKKKPTAPKIVERFKLEVTQGANTSELYFDSEKQLLSFMELKRKTRISEIDRFCHDKSLSKPILQYGRLADYKIESAKYLDRLKAAGLNLELKIVKC